ncbi:hypothetical protein D3C84_944530 [compost metagenome]
MQSQDAAEQQGVGNDWIRDQEAQSVQRFALEAFDEQRCSTKHRSRDGQINSPALLTGVVAVHELVKPLLDKHPTRAGLGAISTGGADPVSVNQRPLHHRRYDQPHQIKRK